MDARERGGVGGGRGEEEEEEETVAAARIEKSSKGGKRRRNIKYAGTDAESHSSLPFLPVSLFPILVPSKRFLLSPFSSSRSCASAALFIQPPLSLSVVYSLLLALCVSRAYINLPRRALLIGRCTVFPSLSHVITVSTVACTWIYTRVQLGGILFFLTPFASGLSFVIWKSSRNKCAFYYPFTRAKIIRLNSAFRFKNFYK